MSANVTLLTNTQLWIADKAIGKCWDKPKDECDVARIERVANKNKHASTIEHLTYSFDITMSRACLQEWARHRIASLSVKSSRYTLKELKNTSDFLSFLVPVSKAVDTNNINTLCNLAVQLRLGLSNDKAKYMLPEAYKTSLVWTINARSLQNFLALRTSPAALWEIRNLAYEVYDNLPEDHKFLFKEYLYETNN